MKKRLMFLSVFLSTIIFFASMGGVVATWFYAEDKPTEKKENVSISLTEFLFVPEDMPEVQVTALQRLSDILNNRYTTEKITDSRDYLINHTIQVYWGGDMSADPYVGSMDVTFAEQINELFKDVLFETGVSFILKSQDLNYDGWKEVALYSTSDPLTCVEEYDGVVCVFVSVFTPVVNAQGNITGYTLVCESLRGYCYEVYYDYTNNTPSFSTDTWKDDVGYYYWDGLNYPLPEPDRHIYEKYNKVYYPEQWWSSRTAPYGNMLWQCLYDKIPYIY